MSAAEKLSVPSAAIKDRQREIFFREYPELKTPYGQRLLREGRKLREKGKPLPPLAGYSPRRYKVFPDTPDPLIWEPVR